MTECLECKHFIVKKRFNGRYECDSGHLIVPDECKDFEGGKPKYE